MPIYLLHTSTNKAQRKNLQLKKFLIRSYSGRASAISLTFVFNLKFTSNFSTRVLNGRAEKQVYPNEYQKDML